MKILIQNRSGRLCDEAMPILRFAGLTKIGRIHFLAMREFCTTVNKERFRGTDTHVRTCIHKRLSRVWKWEILTIVSAEETEIS